MNKQLNDYYKLFISARESGKSYSQREFLENIINNDHALKIIFKRKVNIYWLLNSNSRERYNLIYEDNHLARDRLLTQSEYELIKRVSQKYEK